ncbi:serine dehydratase [Bacillus cereus group sp. BY112LC]|uniref:serine dehydratase n=1 Tax=Bacillus cereus group sp. BY112LC TaxID=3018086 RepID=UPI0022E0625F|nr:serine dehydratase [Bacillus cereus group sp. BY112LC]MDA1876304.1 serine dehydratase [Bacillus cereus group sp. BY112LC]
MESCSMFDIVKANNLSPEIMGTEMGKLARELFILRPEEVNISIYGSFKNVTNKHELQIGFLKGIFSSSEKDMLEKVPFIIDNCTVIKFVEGYAKTSYPYTAKISLLNGTESIEVVTYKNDVGKILISEINGFNVKISENSPNLLVRNKNSCKFLAFITSLFNDYEINIIKIHCSSQKIDNIMVIELDRLPSAKIIERIHSNPYVYTAIVIN